jgi:hypothetical protein
VGDGGRHIGLGEHFGIIRDNNPLRDFRRNLIPLGENGVSDFSGFLRVVDVEHGSTLKYFMGRFSILSLTAYSARAILET